MDWLHRRICSCLEFLGLVSLGLWLMYLTLKYFNEWIFGGILGVAALIYYYHFKDI